MQWCAVERAPRQYSWTGYRQLFEMVRGAGLKLQVVLSFHACGGNVGDLAQVPLPSWVLEVCDPGGGGVRRALGTLAGKTTGAGAAAAHQQAQRQRQHSLECPCVQSAVTACDVTDA
jgi:hypothetical protein